MDEIAGRFARLAPLRAVALCAMGAAALLARMSAAADWPVPPSGICSSPG